MPLPAAQPLNVFQRLIRQWDRIHPYNAAQIMRVRGRPDARQIECAWMSTVLELGLAPTKVVARRFRDDQTAPQLASGTQQTVCILDSDDQTLEMHLTAELNRPFESSGTHPFRPFVVHNKDQTYWVGVVYQHWVADSASIRILLREWSFRMFAPGRAQRSPLSIATQGYWRRFGPDRSEWRFVESLFGLAAYGAKVRRARRVEKPDPSRPNSVFEMHRLPQGIVPSLLQYARRHHVTLNDVFLAAIARVCDRHVAHPAGYRRFDLAVGTVVDLRQATASTNGHHEEFGLYLGFTTVLLRRQVLRNWPSVLAATSKQNARHKHEHTAEASMVRMSFGLLMGRFLSHEKLVEWYYKRLPLSAGISNVNLNRTWVADFYPDPIVEYVRVSPVGPMLPVVFTPSTLGDDLNFGLTYRESALTPQVAKTISQEFCDQLIALASGREPC